MILQLAGYLSGIAILLSFFPYVRDIFLDKTKPERASWLIWTVLGLISFFSQWAKGATWSLTMTGAQAVGDAFVFFLALRYGLGGLEKRDVAGMIGAAIGLGLWGLTGEVAVALFIVIFIDAIGAALTVSKTYEHPSTETVSSWALTFVAGLLACVAVGRLDFVLLAFPFYICLASASVLLSIWLGFRHKQSNIL